MSVSRMQKRLLTIYLGFLHVAIMNGMSNHPVFFIYCKKRSAYEYS